MKPLFCLLFASLIALAGCSHDHHSKGPNEEPGPVVYVPPVANNMQYAASVAPSQKAALDESISVLHLLPLGQSNQKLMSILKVNDLEPATLQRWVEERVQYIVDSDFDIRNAVFEANKPGFSFPQPDVLPDPDKDGVDDDSRDVMMANIGAAIYYVGKADKKLYGIRVPGAGEVVMSSPRVGLLQIGPGLFRQDISGYGNLSSDIVHAGILFHEARHSDGNGKSLSFMHAKCPYGHDYFNRNVCDFASNGPYTIGAMVMKALKEKCSACTTRQISRLDEIYLDQASRLISGYVTIPSHSPSSFKAQPKEWDDAPEGRR